MKRLFIFLSLLCVAFATEAKRPSFPHMYAHRGSWSKNAEGEFVIPENSVAAVAAAKRMGYEGIECDVRYTKDGRMVILHDATLNRTCRRASDYSRLDKPIYLNQLTFEELRRDYVLESTDPELRTPIPTLEQLLGECKRCGIVPMLHSDLMESYLVAQRMFGNDWICFTGGVEHLKKVREFSACTILLAINDGTAEENIARLKQIGGHCGISTMNYSLYTPEFCKALTDAGYEVQASIFPAPHEAYAQRNGITYQLTDFSYMPTKRKADGKFTVYTGWYNKLGMGSGAKRFTPVEKLDYAGSVVKIKMRKRAIKEPEFDLGDVKIGCVDVEFDGRKYEIEHRGKETIYIGRRLMDGAGSKVQTRESHIKNKTCVKRIQQYYYYL